MSTQAQLKSHKYFVIGRTLLLSLWFAFNHSSDFVGKLWFIHTHLSPITLHSSLSHTTRHFSLVHTASSCPWQQTVIATTDSVLFFIESAVDPFELRVIKPVSLYANKQVCILVFKLHLPHWCIRVGPRACTCSILYKAYPSLSSATITLAPLEAAINRFSAVAVPPIRNATDITHVTAGETSSN